MNRAVYAHLLRTYGRSALWWLALGAEIMRTLMIRVMLALIMAKATSSVAAGDIASAKQYTIWFFVVFSLGSIIGVVGEMLAYSTENKNYGKQMTSYYQKLIGKDLSFYRDNQTGYLATSFRQYLDNSLLLVRFIRSDAQRVFISLTAPPIILFIADWRIGTVALAIVLVQIAYIFWASARTNPLRIRAQEVYRKITGEVSDEITNIVAFKSGGLEERSATNMLQLCKEEIEIFWRKQKIRNLLDLPRMLITSFGMTVAFYLILSGDSADDPAAVGLILLTMLYMFQIIRNVSELPNFIITHDEHIAKIYPTLMYIGDSHEDVKDPVPPKELIIKNGAVQIDHISFGYPSNNAKDGKIPVLDDISITIRGGEQIGIVGLSGAGKSTLASLLMRFDDVDSGAIRVDDTDIRDVAQSQLRRHIAYVPQEPLLFHRTIRENITYFNPSATEADVINAAKAAHAHEFITELPDGYDTTVGERGIKLSGGQKQRVVIARAILKKAPIMIFDEATSALDSESEQIIQKALPEILGKQTAVVIAHRLSTVAGLDRILVMQRGHIVEEGTHDELLALKGRYHSLWQKQTNGHD